MRKALTLLSTRFTCDGVGDVISTKLAEGLKALKSDMEKTLQFVTIKNAAPKKVVAGGSFPEARDIVRMQGIYRDSIPPVVEGVLL